jgi:membrane protein
VNVYIHNWLRHQIGGAGLTLVEFAYHLLMILTTFGLTLTMFVILFLRLPNRRLRLNQIFPGALLTALFWEAARSLFTLLLPLFNYRQVYGSIAVVVALMTWAYISSAVMLFGAKVSSVLYRTLEVPTSTGAEPRTVESADKAP